MIILGLTGGIACGKSTVSSYLQELGAPIVDADAIAIALADKGQPLYNAFVEHFGAASALLEDGSLNRAGIGEVVFRDKEERRWMDSTTHPIIKGEMEERLKKLAEEGAAIAVIDVPLLYEVGWDDICDKVWVVSVSSEVQLDRLIKRNGLSEKLARDRINSQMSLTEKAKRADTVIDNSGTIEETRRLVLAAWERLNPAECV